MSSWRPWENKISGTAGNACIDRLHHCKSNQDTIATRHLDSDFHTVPLTVKLLLVKLLLALGQMYVVVYLCMHVNSDTEGTYRVHGVILPSTMGRRRRAITESRPGGWLRLLRCVCVCRHSIYN